MNVSVAGEQRFLRFRERFYTDTVGAYDFWQNYLAVFSSVQVVARARQAAHLPQGAAPADGPGVSIAPLTDYAGPAAGLLHLPRLLAETRRLAWQQAAYVLRVPGLVGTILTWWLTLRRWPFALEVVGDPHDSLSSEALGTRWGDCFRPVLVALLRDQCRRAAAVSYVTREALQRRYPPGSAVATHYSSVALLPGDFAPGCRPRGDLPFTAGGARPAKLIFVGSLSWRHKGLHVLLAALHVLAGRGLQFQLDVLGDGSCRGEVEQQARMLGLPAVHMRGNVPHGEVLRLLREADLFLMPSLVEGLPRAMLEAMASGLPCIGSSVGGIPELLCEDDMVPPGDHAALADRIMAVLGDPGRMRAMGERNRRRALPYRAEVLQARRTQFYQVVRDVTQRRMEGR